MGQRRQESRGEVKSLDKLWFKRHKKEKKSLKAKVIGEITKQEEEEEEEEWSRGIIWELVDKKNTTVHWKLNQAILGLLYEMENQNNSGLKF